MSWSSSRSWGTFVSLMMGSASMVFAFLPPLLPTLLLFTSLLFSFSAWLATKFIERKLVYYIFSLSLGKWRTKWAQCSIGGMGGKGKEGGAEERDAVVASTQINDNQIKFKYIFLFHYTLELKPRELCSIVENSSTWRRQRRWWLWWWWCDWHWACGESRLWPCQVLTIWQWPRWKQKEKEREKEEADKVEEDEDEDEENLTNEISVAVLNISFCISCYSCNHWGWASGLVIVIVRGI